MVDQYHAIDTADASKGQIWWRGLASVGALFLAIILGILVYLVAASNNDRDTAAQRERQSFETIMGARDVERAVARSEAALGRFVIASDRALGTLYRDEWRAADRQIRQLRRLVRNNPEQLARVEQLRTQYDAYGAELSNTANYAAAGRNWEAISLHNQAAESENGPAISRTIAEITRSERSLLGERSTARISATERSNLLAMVLTVAGILLALVALGLAWTVVRAFRDRSKADEQVDLLEDAVAERTAELEALNAELRAEASERAVAEQRLRQAQKMEAVGQLTGGIAHDFNNMLSVVVGGLDLARRKIANGKTDIDRHLDSAADGADRAAALTRRLLAFARAEPLLPEGTNPGALITEMEELLHRTIGERIVVSINTEDDLWPIWVDPRQLENAVLNLAVNARDAMDGEGDLDIKVRNVTLAEDEVADAEAGSYVSISVADEGTGMTPDVVERVFEPFFTTKPVGKGTGLGLSQIFGFARQSGGAVGIETSPEDGTEVSIYLPRYEGEAKIEDSSLHSWEPHPAAKPLKNRTVMVVEDDDRVRVATIEALEELGCEVVGYADGEAALEAFKGRHDISALLTDVVMPGMTGPELAEQVETLNPNLPIVFVTGYVGEAGDNNRLMGRDVLRKPFTMAELARALTQAFEGSPVTRVAAE